MNFSYHNSTQIQFGQGQIISLAELIAKSKRILFIYGKGSIKNNGIYNQVVSALQQHQWYEFSGVEANPTIETLNQAVAIVKQKNINYIVAVGGGSVIDGSKYVAAASCYDGDGWDILEGTHEVTQALPLAAVLTLPATGSESNAHAVITKSQTQQKLAFSSPLVQPKIAVMDPDVMKTLPQRQLVNGIVDAWVHVCEQYLTLPTKALVQEAYAESLLKTLKSLADNFDQQDDQWRANLMWSANQALNGLIGLGMPQDWATHMIGHEITALYGVDHARSLSIIQPALLRHQLHNKKAKLQQMGRRVFGLKNDSNLAELTIEAIEQMYQKLNVPIQLTKHNSDKPAVISAILKQLQTHDRTALGEHGQIGLTQSREILEQAVA